MDLARAVMVFFKSLRNDYYLILAIALISKIYILYLIPWLSLFVVHTPRLSSMGIYELWKIWDVNAYVRIAEYGYQTAGEGAADIAFFPLFPFFIALLGAISSLSFVYSGFVVSTITSSLAAVMFYKLVLLDNNRKIAFTAVTLLFLFPTAFFLHIPYTESLFLFLVVSTFYFLRIKLFMAAFIFAAFASATRLPGIALVPAILVEIILTNRNLIKKKPLILLFALVVPPSGFIFYLVLNYLVHGNFVAFTVLLEKNWGTHFSLFASGFEAAWSSISWRQGAEVLTLGYAQLFAVGLGVISLVYSAFKLPVSYTVYMLVSLLMYSLTSFWLSMPRYIIVLFPMFVFLAKLCQFPLFRYIWFIFSIVLLTVFSLIAIQFGPIM